MTMSIQGEVGERLFDWTFRTFKPATSSYITPMQVSMSSFFSSSSLAEEERICIHKRSL